jgi:ribonuclease HI
MTATILDPKDGILVYTDGSASVKTRAGGWGFVALDSGDGLYENAGGEEDTTISRMELVAPIMALHMLHYELDEILTSRVEEVLIISDSQYVVMGFMNPSRARNKNQDLWTSLDVYAALFTRVVFEHTPGHAGNVWNDRADFLAVKARKAMTN